MSAAGETALDAHAIVADIVAKRTTATTVTESALQRIERLEPAIGAFFHVHLEEARARARDLDSAWAAGRAPGPLAGVPLVVKSNMCVQGRETNCGSRILSGYRPPYTATFLQRALDADCILIGSAHMDEFGMGSSGENSAFHVPRNPWDTSRTPGGSSSGCAAAVAAGMVPLGLGSDTGGSVRQPAALSGISGFKPTYGCVSRYGLVAFGSSLDVVSPLARSVRDLELVMEVIGGSDQLDATTLDRPAPTPAVVSLAGLRIGVPREFFPEALDADLCVVIESALAELRARGAQLVELELASMPHALSMYYIIASAEASSNLARFDGVRYGARPIEHGESLDEMYTATRTAGFGQEVKRRILLGTYVLSSGFHDEWYARARRARALLAQDFTRAFESVDLLVGPTSPTPAFPLGEKRDDPVAMYATDILTVPASLVGLPAVSVPAGFVQRSATSLPVGLQWIGPHGTDARVLAAARAFQEATEHHRARPDLSAHSIVEEGELA